MSSSAMDTPSLSDQLSKAVPQLIGRCLRGLVKLDETGGSGEVGIETLEGGDKVSGVGFTSPVNGSDQGGSDSKL